MKSCVLPLIRQLEGTERKTVRLGEHPRREVHRLDLMDDDALDRFRALHPVVSEAALDTALVLEERVEHSLAVRGLAVSRLRVLPARPLLAVFVCMACGQHAIATCARDWAVDDVMEERSMLERDALGTHARRRA